MNCDNCGKEIHDALDIFTCNYCKGKNCDECRLPEFHNCVGFSYNDEPKNTRKKRSRKIIIIPIIIIGILVFATTPNLFSYMTGGISNEMESTTQLIHGDADPNPTIKEPDLMVPELSTPPVPPTPPKMPSSITPVPNPSDPQIPTFTEIKPNEISDPKRKITWNLIERKQNVLYNMPYQPSDIPKFTQAVQKGFDIWESMNPNYDFVRSFEDPDIEVYWDMIPSDEHLGLAHYSRIYSGTITINVGGFDCNDVYIEIDHDSITDTTMHEIGHLIGLDHTLDESHLMYGLDGVSPSYFDERNLIIPEGEDHKMAGQKKLESRQDDLDSEMNKIDSKLNEIDDVIDSMLDRYGMSRLELERDNTIHDPILYDKIIPLFDRYNDYVERYNSLSDEFNRISEKINCMHDV